MVGQARTVLVVDDDEGLRMLCRVNLELEGYRVLEAPTVDSAAEALDEQRVDVVLLDVHVGANDGLSLLEQIRRVRPAAGVALFTGTSDVTPEQRASVEEVLPKPFSLEQLSQTVRRLALHGR
ncbi:MAG: response regulator [Gaiellaceae bacterium]